MPARASFMTERYVRDHGVYTNWAEIAPDTPDLRLGAARGRATTPRCSARRTCTSTRTSRSPHIDDTGRASSRRSASPRCTRPATSSSARSPTATPTSSRDRGLLDAYKQHIADRSYQGENENGQNATKCVPMWDSTPMPLPLDAYVDTWHGDEAVEWIEQYDRAGALLPLRRVPRSARPVGRAPRGGATRYRDLDMSMPRSTRRPTVEGTGRYGALLSSFLWRLGHRDDDRRRHPRHATRLRRRHLGHRRRGRPHRRARSSAGGCSTTRGSSTRATTARWAGTTG